MRNFKNKKFLLTMISSILCGVVFLALGLSFLVPKNSEVINEPVQDKGDTFAVSAPPAGENWIDYAASSFASGTGSSTDPYIISSAEELAYLAKTTNEQTVAPTIQYYRLELPQGETELDLSGKYWTPIGDYSTNKVYFRGYFYGEGYTISGMYVGGTMQYAGLFGRSTNSFIYDLSIENSVVDVTSSAALYAGGLGGYLSATVSNITIENVSITADSSGGAVYAGGFAGALYGTISDVTINNVSVSADSLGGLVDAGGVCGQGGPTATDLNINGSVHAETSAAYAIYAGGFVGSGSPTLTNVITNVEVSAESTGGKNAYAGGLCGSGIPVITGVTTNGSVYAETTGAKVYAGGASGNASTAVSKQIINFENKAEVNGVSDNIVYSGGIFGYFSGTDYLGSASSVKNSGDVSANSSANTAYAGGFCGYEAPSSTYYSATLTVINVGDVTANGKTTYAGGASGYIASLSSVSNRNINCEVKALSTTGSACAGGLCGAALGISSSVSNIRTNGLIQAECSSATFAGGLCGVVNNYNKTIDGSSSCKNSATVKSISGTTAYAGGIVGSGVVTKVTNVGDVSAIGGSAYAGGIGGYMGETSTCSISTSSNEGKIVAQSTTGGVVYAAGIFAYKGQGSGITFKDVYNTGKVESSSDGQAVSSGISCFFTKNTSISYTTNFMNCFNAGEIKAISTGSSASAAGIFYSSLYVGTFVDCFNLGNLYASGSTYSYTQPITFVNAVAKNCYWDSSIQATPAINSTTGTSFGAVSNLKNLMQDLDNLGEAPFGTYVNGVNSGDAVWSQEWSAVWDFNISVSEFLIFYDETNQDFWEDYASSSFESGDGSSNNPFIIKTPQQLAYLAKTVNEQTSLPSTFVYYELGDDIDLSSYSWKPIGSYQKSANDKAYYIQFNGKGFKITGMKVRGDILYAGLFGRAEYTNIKNLIIENSVVKASNTNYVGAIAGYLSCSYQNASDSFCNNVSRVKISTTATGSSNSTGGVVGGFVGEAVGSAVAKIDNIKNYGNIISDSGSIGGVFGSISSNVSGKSVQASRLLNEGSITKTTTNNSGNVGGLVGSAYGTTICDSINSIDIDVFAQYVGGIAGSGTGKNLINNGNISGSKYVGGIFGSGSGEYLTNNGDVKIEMQTIELVYAGGIAATGAGKRLVNNGNVIIKKTANSSGYSNGETYAGGMFALSSGVVSYSQNNGDVLCETIDVSGAGGIIGKASSTGGGEPMVSCCYNSGNINATSKVASGNSYSKSAYAGGMIGNAYGDSSTRLANVINSYNEGNISNSATTSGYSSAVGGIVGISSCAIDVKNCFNIGVITDHSFAYVGGILGSGSGKVKDCWSLSMGVGAGTKSNSFSNAGTNKVDDLDELMKNEANFGTSSFGTYTQSGETLDAVWSEEWDFYDVWCFESSISDYPILFFTIQDPETWASHASLTFSAGDGTEESPYIISSGADLALLAKNVNTGASSYAYYQLGCNIDLSDYLWESIGNNQYSFLGNFDGNGFVISGMKLKTLSTYLGLFGSVVGTLNNHCVIKNVELTNGYIAQTNEADIFIGNIVAVADGYVDFINIKNYNKIITNGSCITSIGGIVGLCKANSVISAQNVYNYGKIKMVNSLGSYKTWIGGIIGKAENKTVDFIVLNSLKNYGDIYYETPTNGGAGSGVTLHIGGIAGYFSVYENRDYSDLYNFGNIKCYCKCLNQGYNSNCYLGGIFGQIEFYNNTKNLKLSCGNEGEIKTLSAQRRENFNFGGITSYISSGNIVEIENSYNFGDLSPSLSKINGGFVGFFNGTKKLIIKASYVSSNLTASYNSSSNNVCVGGFVGDGSGCNDIIISDCYFIGSISTYNVSSSSYYDYGGGLIGYTTQNLVIENSFAKGEIKTYKRAGGLVGGFNSTSKTLNISNSFFEGDIIFSSTSTSGFTAGGIIGYVSCKTNGSYITNCYAVGNLYAKTLTSLTINNLQIGSNNTTYRPTLSNYYYDITINLDYDSTNEVYGTTTQNKAYSGIFEDQGETNWFFDSNFKGGQVTLKNIYWVGSGLNQTDEQIKNQLESLGITELAA